MTEAMNLLNQAAELANDGQPDAARNAALSAVLKRNPDHIHAQLMQDQIRAGTLPSLTVASSEKRKPFDAPTDEKRYYTPAALTLIGYLAVGPLAMVANIYFLIDAHRIRRETGTAPAGMGCLWAMLIVNVLLLALLVVSVLILLAVGDDLIREVRLMLGI